MNTRRRLLTKKKELVLYTKRFYPAGNYTWLVPEGCTEVDVFLVGGGGGAGIGAGGGGGYTKTFKSSTNGWKDGDAIPVTPGQYISIIVGAGGSGIYTPSEDYYYGKHKAYSGEYSQFMNDNYRAYGGKGSGGGYLHGNYGGDGGSGGGSYYSGASDGEDAPLTDFTYGKYYPGKGQGHTTRDFGESSGKRNAGGGSGGSSAGTCRPGASDYTEGSGSDGEKASAESGYKGRGGGGYGGGAGGSRGAGVYGGTGGDGTVLIRYYAYEQ